MADLIGINTSKDNGRQVLSALNQINTGIAVLKKLNGLRAESIAKGAAVMQTNFGTDSTASATQLSDRWVNFLTAFDDSGNAEYGKLRDLLNAVLAQ